MRLLQPASVLSLLCLLPASLALGQREFAKQPIPYEDIEAARQNDAAAIIDRAAEKSAKAATPRVSNDFIVFGYVQSHSQIAQTRWHALTHVGSLFLNFDSTGTITDSTTFTNRDATLKAGGAAQAAGVKVIAVIRNTGFDVNVTNTVLTNATARAKLVSEVARVVNGDAYCAGASFDFEPFSWSTAARDGMTIFFRDLRAAIPGKEISLYSDPTPVTSGWDVAGIAPNLDYMLYSGYDWGSGNTPHAITDHNSCLTGMKFYLSGGLPPSKLVSVISSYGRLWSGTNTYDQTGLKVTSQGFTDGLYNTTLNTAFGGPYASNYVRGDEGVWHTYNDGTEDYVMTWDSPESMEYKIRHALSFQDPTGVYNGARLRGVGFWSLMWMAETSSWDPNTQATVSRVRTYPQIYQICQKVLAKPGQESFLIDGFEGLDTAWRDPNFSPDTTGDTDSNSAFVTITKPTGTGAPTDSTRAAQLTFDFEGTGANRLFMRHELLGNPATAQVAIPDTNSTAAKFDASTAISAAIRTPSAYAGYTVRMVVMDKDRQLEMSPAYTLATSGWRTITWDLTSTAAGNITGYNTNEPAFVDGNGALATAGDGAEDISFIGFLVEGTGATNSATLVIDELAYSNAVPANLNYKINEFRYTGSAGEFVEIQGPVGAIPTGTELRFYNSADATFTSVALGGAVVPASGLLVVGDPTVPNVGLSTGFTDAANNIPDTAPTGLQLYNATAGYTIDSVVYLAFGGLKDLIRIQAKGVADEGYPWLGALGNGTDSSGQASTFGRYPDGADTQMNAQDFSVMKATPGVANGRSISNSVATLFDFEAVHPGTRLAYNSTGAGAVNPGVIASPAGGKVFRVVDVTGGGQMAYFGDAALGTTPAGYTASGLVYLPGTTEPAQAIGLGICGRQGTSFFAATKALQDTGAYESGYWLLFENKAGVTLADGRPDHGSTFEFVHASHDNMDTTPVTLLASAPVASLPGVSQGAWTSFALSIDPSANRLVAVVGGNTIYNGAIPAGGPTSGAFQAGFRENHSGAPAATEGTWIDALTITPRQASEPVSDRWILN